ncbi:hypothetical protein PVAP13_2KG347840 [Panicum virgatum]|uniref:Uncharacterized protein n=1 Tax=Panicum virgatum TaxID=38727 RepID=A0A8T0WG76_PANVG|nr:hypothetical protein PVAP13_2KG347840 [Panicum virgatum]
MAFFLTKRLPSPALYPPSSFPSSRQSRSSSIPAGDHARRPPMSVNPSPPPSPIQSTILNHTPFFLPFRRAAAHSPPPLPPRHLENPFPSGGAPAAPSPSPGATFSASLPPHGLEPTWDRSGSRTCAGGGRGAAWGGGAGGPSTRIWRRAGLPWRRTGGQVACAHPATRAATYGGRCAGPAASEAARTGRVAAGRGRRCRPARGRAGAGAAASCRSQAVGLLRRSRGDSRPCRRGTHAGSRRAAVATRWSSLAQGPDEDQPPPVTRMEAPPCSSSSSMPVAQAGCAGGATHSTTHEGMRFGEERLWRQHSCCRRRYSAIPTPDGP